MSEVDLLPGLDRVVFSAAEIRGRVEEMAREIDAYYPEGEELLVFGLLKGAFIFVSDLVRSIRRPELRVDFLVAALYGEERMGNSDVRLLYESDVSVEGRHVLLVEDIVDSGKTLARIGDALAERSPKSLEVCALLHKRLTRDLSHEPRWVGFDAPPDWLVGYGLDHRGRFRQLPFIAAIDSGEE